MSRRSKLFGSRGKEDRLMFDDLTGVPIWESEARMLEGEQFGLYTHYSNWNPKHPQQDRPSPRPDQVEPPLNGTPPDTYGGGPAPEDL